MFDRPSQAPPEKLLYLMNHYSSQGATHFAHVFALLREMADQGTRIRLVIEQAESKPPLDHPGIDVRCLPNGITGYRRWFSLVHEIEDSLHAGYRTVFIRISAWSALAAIWASRGSRGKVFFWQSGTTIEFDKAQPFGRRKMTWFFRSRLPAMLVWRLTDVFVTGPSVMLDYYASVGRVARNKLQLLHNDVDHRRFTWAASDIARLRQQLRDELHLPPETVVLLLVHRLSPVRRTLDYLPLALLRARDAGLLDGVCLVVVGGGGDLTSLQEEFASQQLKANVRFLGERPNAGIESLYAAADIFLQPSHAEGFPRVLVEAMVAGLPIVTTDAGGSAEILGPLQQTFVTPRDEPELFAQALVSLLSRRDLWESLGRDNAAVAKAYDTPVVARMYRRVLFGV